MRQVDGELFQFSRGQISLIWIFLELEALLELIVTALSYDTLVTFFVQCAVTVRKLEFILFPDVKLDL